MDRRKKKTDFSTYTWVSATEICTTIRAGEDGISEEDIRLLRELDREGGNRERAETRRHVSLDKIAQAIDLSKTPLLRSPNDGPSDIAEQRMAIQALQDELTFDQKELLDMLLAGWSVPDIARLEGVTASAIWQRIKHIRYRLEKTMEKSFH